MVGKIRKRVGRRGTSWQVMVELTRDPETGKRRQKLLTAPTKQEAEDLALEMKLSVRNGGFAEADAKKIIVSQYLDRWLSSVAPTMRPSSHRRYADIARRHINPII